MYTLGDRSRICRSKIKVKNIKNNICVITFEPEVVETSDCKMFLMEI